MTICNICEREIKKGEIKFKRKDKEGFYTLNICQMCKIREEQYKKEFQETDKEEFEAEQYKNIKCIKCGSSKYLADYEGGFYECEKCCIKFKINIIEEQEA